MGYHRFLRRSLILSLSVIVATPVLSAYAQEAQPGFSLPPAASTPPPADTRQQGPELDVFRAPATPPAAPPPVVAPTVTPVPTRVPTPVPTSVPTPTQRQTPARVAPAPRAAAPAAPTDDPAERTPETPSPAIVAPPPQAEAAPEAVAPQDAPPVPSDSAPSNSLPWPWIIGGAVALIALAAAFLRTRRRTDPVLDEALAAPIPAPRSAPPVPAPAPEPAPVIAPPPASDRPWIAADMVVTQARYAMMGVTIAYDLLLHNHGDHPAQDVLVRGVIGNAGAQQQALLDAFFTGQSGLPLHSAVAIAPGETTRLSGELRLSPDEIVPVAMGQRSLLIPIIAFDTAYRWGAEGEDAPDRQGRTARAFIVGQDQEPPADRLAPFRLDQGARHYRRAAARAVAELTPA